MGDSFDPYYRWLGIPPREQPPNLYRLLGITVFEEDADVIDAAANRQMAHLRTYQTGPHGVFSQQLLNEVAAARVTLLSPGKKAAYDELLRHELSVAGAQRAPFAELGDGEGRASSAIPDAAVSTAMAQAPASPASPRRWSLTTAIGIGLGLLILAGATAVWLAQKAPAPPVVGQQVPRPRPVPSARPVPAGQPSVKTPPAGQYTLEIDWPKRLRKGGTLQVDGRPVPLPPQGPIALRVPQGEHMVVASRPGFKPFRWQVHMAEDAVARSTPEWLPLTGGPAGSSSPKTSAAPEVVSSSAKTPPVPQAGSVAIPAPTEANPPETPGSPPGLLPVPSKESRDALAAQIEELYKLSEIRDDAQRRSVAHELYALAGQTTNASDERFALFQQVVELAADCCDFSLMVQGIDALADEYAIDLPAVQAWAWQRLAEATDQPDERTAVANGFASLLAAESAGQDASGTAGRIASLWDIAARSSQGSELKSLVESRRRELAASPPVPGGAGEAQKTDPEIDAILREGWNLARQRKNREAGEKLLEAARWNRDDIRARFSLGLLEALVGKAPARAEEHFGLCVDVADDHVPSLNNHAITEVREGLYRQAIRDWNAVLAVGPPPKEVVQNVGRFVWQAQNRRLAVPVTLSRPVKELWEKVQAGAAGYSFDPRHGYLYMPYTGPGANLVGWSDPSAYHDNTCILCDGKGVVPCPHRGCVHGTVRVPKTRIVGRVPATGAPITENYTAKEPCPTCQGRGVVDCPFCQSGIDSGL